MVMPARDTNDDHPMHEHPEALHTHDHYHVTHHHRDGMLLGEWDHRTSWHSHPHNHSATTHSHEYSVEDEERDHDKDAHIHDHAAPAVSPASPS